jgi:type VI secretion system secreted protein Hcp
MGNGKYDGFLKLDGIKGSSVDSKHKGESDIDSFSWEMSQTGSGHRGSGSGAGKVDIQDIEIRKEPDLSSPSLMLASASGKHIAKGKITIRKAGENPLDYLTIDLEQILISHYKISHADTGDVTPTESFRINFGKMKLEFWTQTDKGAKGDNANFSWDVLQNVKF